MDLETARKIINSVVEKVSPEDQKRLALFFSNHAGYESPPDRGKMERQRKPRPDFHGLTVIKCAKSK